MKAFRPWICVVGLLSTVWVAYGAEATKQAPTVGDVNGLHDFDFEFGRWSVHHRVKRPTGDWVEYQGICSAQPLMFGAGNVEDHVFDKPEGTTTGVGLRAYDPKTAQWAIWWIDGRDPHGALDPPVKGRFEHGVGMFYADGPLNGKMIRTRYMWSKITATSAHWEQASSSDGGKTWDTNWYMDFTRIS